MTEETVMSQSRESSLCTWHNQKIRSFGARVGSGGVRHVRGQKSLVEYCVAQRSGTGSPGRRPALRGIINPRVHTSSLLMSNRENNVKSDVGPIFFPTIGRGPREDTQMGPGRVSDGYTRERDVW